MAKRSARRQITALNPEGSGSSSEEEERKEAVDVPTPQRKISKPVRPSERFKSQEHENFMPKTVPLIDDSYKRYPVPFKPPQAIPKEQKTVHPLQPSDRINEREELFGGLNSSFVKAIDTALKKNPFCDLSSTLFPQYNKHAQSILSGSPVKTLQDVDKSMHSPRKHHEFTDDSMGTQHTSTPNTSSEHKPVGESRSAAAPSFPSLESNASVKPSLFTPNFPLLSPSISATHSASLPQNRTADTHIEQQAFKESAKPAIPTNLTESEPRKHLFDKVPSFSLPSAPAGEELKPFSFGGITAPLFGEKHATFSVSPVFPQSHHQSKPFSFGSSAPLQQSVFGAMPQSQFTFAPSVPAQDTEEEGVDDVEDISEAKRLPDNDPKLKTGEGEEGDECVVEERSKLFYWDNTTWKELGIGNAKINRNSGTNKYRFIFRTEGSGKTLVNSWLKGIQAEAKGKEIFLTIPQQQPEGHTKSIKYLLRTKSVECSTPIIDAIKRAQTMTQ